MENNTIVEFDKVINQCRGLFMMKSTDYGTSWRIMRTSSLTDQIYIKAARIRKIEESKEQKISDSLESEYVGMINYSVMAIYQLSKGTSNKDNNISNVRDLFDSIIKENKELLSNKNHDYDKESTTNKSKARTKTDY